MNTRRMMDSNLNDFEKTAEYYPADVCGSEVLDRDLNLEFVVNETSERVIEASEIPSTLGDIYGKNKIHLPFYPAYSEEQRQAWSQHPAYYYADKSELTSSAIAGKAIPLMGEEDRMLIPASADIAWLRDYYEELLNVSGGQFDGVDYYEDVISHRQGFRGKLENVLNRDLFARTVSLHPIIDKEGLVLSSFFVDPDVAAKINDKRYLSELTSVVPNRKNLVAAELRDPKAYSDLKFPFWVKNGASSGGDGVMQVHSHEDVLKAIDTFGANEILIAEEHFESTNDYNVQIAIHEDGKFSFVGYSEQRVEGSKHLGNLIDTSNRWLDLPHTVRKVVVEIAESAREKGMLGVAGLDIMYNEETGRAVFPDPNFRLNGSSGLQMKRPEIATALDGSLLQSGAFVPREFTSMQSVRDKLARFFEKGHLVVLGGAQATREMPNVDRAQGAKFYGAIAGNDADQIAARKEAIEREFIVS